MIGKISQLLWFCLINHLCTICRETKLKTTDRGMAAKLAPHISDYELLASLQRAAQGNRNFPHTSGADGVTLALENNSLSAVSETRLERTAAHIHRVVAAAPQSQCDSPSNSSGDGNMSPVADNEDVNASVKAENDVENYEKSFTSLNRTDSIDAPRPLLFSSKNSTTAMQPPDGQVRESKKFASMLEAENEHLRDTEYLVVDCPEEIVSIVELGLCSSINRSPHVESSREDQINSIECLVENPDSSFSSNNSSTKFNDGILTVETNSFSMTNKDPLPQHEESIPCGEKLTGHQAAIDSHETSDGFSDYDSDDGGLEAELSQWHKSAGALLSKAQKRAD
ncbi:uncharacterized protein LOC108683451 [Hyalella azteca]|uniref:Uncharacterized protein LOC108683451 n=1 Tax=Hyalella azteca TaxID=294128 RepID=A0A8B7PSU3_HYAAZ|nr:uncharacterized protein LOC108683451 [Hyalella azteca]